MADDPTQRAFLRVRRDVYVDAERSPRFLWLRSVALQVEAPDGTVSGEGTWDFVERPAGFDAVVVVVYRRAASGVEVLLRRGLRVPTAIGRQGQVAGPGRHPAVFIEEIVAGLVEPGEDTEPGMRARARDEVEEEAGIALPLSAITRLGGPLWATPSLCAEVLHWFAADATGVEPALAHGDGSPFEMLSSIGWYPLADAIARVSGGPLDTRDAEALGDMRAELGFRRLEAHLREPAR